MKAKRNWSEDFELNAVGADIAEAVDLAINSSGPIDELVERVWYDHHAGEFFVRLHDGRTFELQAWEVF